MTRLAAVLAAAIAFLLGWAVGHAAHRPCPEADYRESDDGVQPVDPYLVRLA